jgi:hypothetical protein
MKWILDIDKSDDESDKKYWKILNKLGIKCSSFKYLPFMNLKDIRESIDSTVPIMCHGVITFISKIQRIEEFKPGSYCNFKELECRSYYPLLKDFLLNSDYKIVTWKYLLEHPFSGVKFIRPNSGKKVFTGTITDHDHLSQDVGLSIANISDNTLVLVTSVKNVLKEWRFYVGKGIVITGSQYHENDKLCIKSGYDNGSYNLAFVVSKVYNHPDPIYVVDICLTDTGEYKVMELNGFSCSGLYECDAEKIVRYVEDNS